MASALAAALILSGALAAQIIGPSPIQEPPLPPLGGAHAVLEFVKPEKRPELGFWPVDQLYGLTIDAFGREKTDKWIARGIQSMQKNMYRKHYIEEGYFLIPLPAPDAPAGDDDYMLFFPKDAKDHPLVILMKDAHRLAEATGAMHEQIVRSILDGDKDLIRLAGRTLFDSKFTARDWSHTLSGSDFQGTGAKDERPYFYKFRQNGLTKLRVEGGAGKSFELGKDYFVGGSLGAEAGAKYRGGEFGKDAVPRAKLGFWGKLPGVDGGAFGLTAIQGWHADGGVFETELRAGLFQSFGRETLAVSGYHRFSGKSLGATDDRATGAQVFFSPTQVVGFFLNGEYVQPSAGKDYWEVFGGLAFTPREKGLIAVGQLVRAFLEPVEVPESAAAFYDLTSAALDQCGQEARPEAAIGALRERELARTRDFVLWLPGGRYLVLQAAELLEAARAVEKWNFLHAAKDAQILPGWSPRETGPRSGEETLKRLLGRLPASELRALEAEPGFDLKRLERILLVHASAARRNADFRVAQGAAAAALLAKRGHAETFAHFSGDDAPSDTLAAKLAHLPREKLSAVAGRLGSAGNWLRREFRTEGEKLQAGLQDYGRESLRRAMESPSWPKGLAIQVQEDAWAPALAGYGEAFLSGLLEPYHKAAAGGPVTVELGFTPIGHQLFARRMSPGRYYLNLPPPDPKKSRGKLLAEMLVHVRRTLPD